MISVSNSNAKAPRIFRSPHESHDQTLTHELLRELKMHEKSIFSVKGTRLGKPFFVKCMRNGLFLRKAAKNGHLLENEGKANI